MTADDLIVDSVLVALDSQCDLILQILESNRSTSRALKIQRCLHELWLRLAERANLWPGDDSVSSASSAVRERVDSPRPRREESFKCWHSTSVAHGSLTARIITRIRNAAIARAWRTWVAFAAKTKTRRLACPLDDLVISPLCSASIAWSLLVVLCLLYILIMQPLEIAYLERQYFREGQPLAVVARAIDVIFIVDVWVNFHTGYFDQDDEQVLDRAKIVRRYLRSWFLLDLISSITPVIEIVVVLATRRSFSTSSIQSAKILKIGRIFKIIKMLRFSKLAKLVDSNSAIMDQIEDFASTSHSKFVAKFIFLVVFSFSLGHIIACCMAVSGNGWFSNYNRDNPNHDATEWSWQRRYTLGLYWCAQDLKLGVTSTACRAFTTISTVGFGDVRSTSLLSLTLLPQVAPASDRERIYGIVVIFFGYTTRLASSCDRPPAGLSSTRTSSRACPAS